MIEYVLVGSTVYQKQWFYSGPWAAGMLGAAGVPGVLVSQGVLDLHVRRLPGRHGD